MAGAHSRCDKSRMSWLPPSSFLHHPSFLFDAEIFSNTQQKSLDDSGKVIHKG